MHNILAGSHFLVHCLCQDFQFLLDLEGKNISDLDKNFVSELRKFRSFRYKKLVDHDRIPLTILFLCLHARVLPVPRVGYREYIRDARRDLCLLYVNDKFICLSN